MTTLLFLLLINLGTTIDPAPITLEQTFDLEKEHIAIYAEGEISIELVKVMDSRCPENTNCIWAGELSVQVAINNKGKVTSETLTVPAIGTRNSRSEVQVDDLLLTFLGQADNKLHKPSSSTDLPIKFEFLLSSESDTIREK
jgi:hypothetical protein